MAIATVYGLAGLSNWAKAQDLALAGADFSAALRQCSVAIRGDALENFQQSADPDGTAWPALSALTVATRRQGSSRPLQDRGLLMGSVTGRGGDNYERLEPHSLEIGSNLIYARIHQEGGTITPKNGRALAVPLTVKARKAGRPGDFPGDLFRARGTGVLATAKVGKRSTAVEPQYVLLASVRIPARAFLGFGSRLKAKIDEIIGGFVETMESK